MRQGGGVTLNNRNHRDGLHPRARRRNLQDRLAACDSGEQRRRQASTSRRPGNVDGDMPHCHRQPQVAMVVDFGFHGGASLTAAPLCALGFGAVTLSAGGTRLADTRSTVLWASAARVRWVTLTSVVPTRRPAASACAAELLALIAVSSAPLSAAGARVQQDFASPRRRRA